MTEPVINTSIKPFSRLQGKPASSTSYTGSSRYEDWGSRQAVGGAPTPNNKLFIPVSLRNPEPFPINILRVPVVVDVPELEPIKTFSFPVVVNQPAPFPIKILL